jgi:hypothetical protein
LPLFKAKGALNCPGAIGRIPKGENYPFPPLIIYNVRTLATMSTSSKLLTAIQFLKGSTEENKIKGEVPYGLFLIFAAFNKDPHQREYASYLSYLRTNYKTGGFGILLAGAVSRQPFGGAFGDLPIG